MFSAVVAVVAVVVVVVAPVFAVVAAVAVVAVVVVDKQLSNGSYNSLFSGVVDVGAADLVAEHGWLVCLLHGPANQLTGNFSFVSTTAAVNKPIGNNSCFTMVMTNCFWAQQQTNNNQLKIKPSTGK